MIDRIIDASWREVLSQEFEKPYFQTLQSFIRKFYTEEVFPPQEDIFRAFNLCPFESVRVVILGQDPYHGVGQANGLCFAVNSGVALPPSLKNIFKEVESDLGYKPMQDGDLSRWAQQGVLLLNSVLTVYPGKPASHKELGWERFTDTVIQELNKRKKNIVYLLWGKYAEQKGSVIDKSNNLVLVSGHPSPFSARLFHGNHHFSSCNTYLLEHSSSPIDWR